MSGKLQRAARMLLREHPDGLTTQAIGAKLQLGRGSMWNVLSSMPDAYVDRWTPSKEEGRGSNTYAAVWCVVVPPENCPHPTRGNPMAQGAATRDNVAKESSCNTTT